MKKRVVKLHKKGSYVRQSDGKVVDVWGISLGNTDEIREMGFEPNDVVVIIVKEKGVLEVRRVE